MSDCHEGHEVRAPKVLGAPGGALDVAVPGGRDATWVVLYESLDSLMRGVADGSLDINAPDCVGLPPVIAAVLLGDDKKLHFLLGQPGIVTDVGYKGKTFDQWRQWQQWQQGQQRGGHNGP